MTSIDALLISFEASRLVRMKSISNEINCYVDQLEDE